MIQSSPFLSFVSEYDVRYAIDRTKKNLIVYYPASGNTRVYRIYRNNPYHPFPYVSIGGIAYSLSGLI